MKEPMNQIVVVNKHRITRGNHRTIYIGRPSALGNPFPITDDCSREQSIKQYAGWLTKQIDEGNRKVIGALEHIASLTQDASGEAVQLVCYCAPKACHGDLIRQVVIKAIERN
jgi:hypothetical protein